METAIYFLGLAILDYLMAKDEESKGHMGFSFILSLVSITCLIASIVIFIIER